MHQAVQFGSKMIPFTLLFSNRKTLGITVTPELEVIVKAPFESDLELIKEKILKRAPWIIKQQGYFLSFFPKNIAKKYVAGETHFYLGKQYKLKIIIDDHEFVKLKGAFLEVSTQNKSNVKSLLKDWYIKKSTIKFHEFSAPLIERFKKYGVEPSSILLKEMSTRWGSCTPTGKIILNPELIKAPKGCIEYVIIHELCHLIHLDHTKKFLDLQTKEMNDWEKWKMKLEKLLA